MFSIECFQPGVGTGEALFGLGQIHNEKPGHQHEGTEIGEEQNPTSGLLRVDVIGEAQRRQPHQAKFHGNENGQANAAIYSSRARAVIEEQADTRPR